MTISIKLPNDLNTGCGTEVFNRDGVKIEDITKININIEADAFVYATVEVAINELSQMDNIHTLLGTKTLEGIALLHGFKLERISTVGSYSVKDAKSG